ncbi:MAG TPA: ATP-binding protein [Thermoanaerobaculia bacterium]|nr:ATP-binding protein [Thermoanaerobaculia bacterium]
MSEEIPAPSPAERHRRSNRLILAGLSLLLVVFTAAFYLLQRGRDLPAALVTNRVLLFVLWYVNVVLILIILFVLLRNSLRLLLERHHRILGSQFKTKLVATYIGLSLIPVLLLFVISQQLLRGSIDRWFSTPIERILPLGSKVAQRLVVELEEASARDAAAVLGEVVRTGGAGPEARRGLPRRLSGWLRERGLDYLAVFEGTEFVQGTIGEKLADLPDPARTVLREAVAQGMARGQSTLPSGALLVVAARRDAAAGEAPVVVVTGRLLEAELAGSARQLIDAAQAFRQLEVQRDDLKASYLLIFLMMTLLILLASSWVGLYLARRVTVPIQALAEGTRRITSGDLDHRVEAAADDELGVLVSSFNQMTSELAASKTQLETSNRELVTANQRLGTERALIAAVLENVTAGVVSIDADGRIFTCNRAALAMLRQREAEVLGRPLAEAWSDPERRKLAALVAGAAPARGRMVREVQMILDSDWRTFEVKLTRMTSAAEGGPVAVLVLEELTELIQAQQVAAWQEAARRIAHEIKNPLTPIQLAAERLLAKWQRGDADVGQALEDGVEIIVREVRTMQGMVDEFSRYARMPRPQPVPIEVASLVGEVVHLYRDIKPGVAVRGSVAPEVGEVQLDPEQIRRALINLIDNAIEATDAPGTVEVAARKDNGHLVIDVADQGRGIPAEAREKLFLPYFSTKGRGTGLGLAIVHRIVTDHHGRVTVEDNLPQGTIFSIELPAE